MEMEAVSHNLQQTKDEDRLSALPDHILLSILDSVDVHTAVRVGILLRRWRHLPWLLSQLDIGATSFFPAPRTVLMVKDLQPAMATFTKVTESFLAAPASKRTIDSLRLKFWLRKKYMRDIGKLLGEAIDSGRVAGCVELVIAGGKSKPNIFGRSLMHFACESPNVFGRLNKLCLYHLCFDGSDDIARLLTSCKHLGALTLNGCDCGEGVVLEIDTPDTQLEELFFYSCTFKRIELLRVPKLVRLTCDFWSSSAAPLSFGSVPCLEQLNINNAAYPGQVRFKLSKLLANTARIQHLSLDFCGNKIWIQLEDPKQLVAAFSKLKILVLENIFYECDLSWTMLLLRAAPLLETFHIQIYKHNEPERDDEEKRTILFPLSKDLLQNISDFKHCHLKELKVTGFMAEDKQTQFIRLVLERAVSLKNIILTDNEPCVYCNAGELHTSSLARSTFPENKDEKDFIVKQLNEGISSPVQIIIR